ncbi:MAG: TIGR03545 family protein [bacterium]
MRPKGMIGLILVIALIMGIAYLIRDKLVEKGMEKTGESIVGAKVEIDNLDFRPAELSISLNRVQVTNPNDTWKNLFETGRMSFDVELEPLSRKRVIINDITIADIRIGTKRETDGRLQRPKDDPQPGWIDKAAESMKKKLVNAPILNLGILNQKIDLDHVFAAVDLDSPTRIDNLKLDVEKKHRLWQRNIAEFDPKQDLTRIETEITELKGTEVKNLTDLISILEKSKRAHKTLNEFKKKIEQKKKQATGDFNQTKIAFAQVDNWIADDFIALKSKANIGDFSPQNVAKMLFGKSITDYLLDFLPYIDLVRTYMPVAEQFIRAGKVEKPPRFQGQNVRFPITYPIPDFLIENVLISGATNHSDSSEVLHVSGTINGVTSHPRLYGKPLVFQLSAQLPNSNAYHVTGEFDHTGDIPGERFEIKASGVRLGHVDLPERPYLPNKLYAERGDVSTQFQLQGEKLMFMISLNARQVNFSFPDSLKRDNVISKATTDVFRSVDKLHLSAKIEGDVDALGLSIHSNIDDVLASRIKALIGESAQAAGTEIQKRLNTKVAPRKKEAAAVVTKFQKNILSEINHLESGINSQLAFWDKKKKEVEKKVAEEKAKGAKDITKKLKDIFKKN